MADLCGIPMISHERELLNTSKTVGGSSDRAILLERTISSQSDEGVVADCPILTDHDFRRAAGGEDQGDSGDNVTGASEELSINYPDMRDERERLKSFETWSLPFLSPESMVNAGFFFKYRPDRVCCAFCGLELENWQPGDNPINEHRLHAKGPCCVLSSGYVGSSSSAYPQGEDICGRFATFRNLLPTVTRASQPFSPEMGDYKTRFATFANWPQDKAQSPRDLAMAGLFFTGDNDRTECFHCGGRLERWDPQDEPWAEHARWYPTCHFLVISKGQEFIDTVQDQLSSSPTSSSSGIEDFSFSSSQGSSASERAASDEEVEEGLVEVALRQKMDWDSVLEALTERRQHVGFKRFHTMAELADAVMKIENRKRDHKKKIEDIKKGALVVKSEIPVTDADQLRLENEKLRKERMCKVCLDRDSQLFFQPCNHLVCCNLCARYLDTCPVCRTKIQSRTQVFLA